MSNTKEYIESFDFGFTSNIRYRVISEFYDGIRGDTEINLDGVKFSISGSDINSFVNDFKKLIEKYFI